MLVQEQVFVNTEFLRGYIRQRLRLETQIFVSILIHDSRKHDQNVVGLAEDCPRQRDTIQVALNLLEVALNVRVV